MSVEELAYIDGRFPIGDLPQLKIFNAEMGVRSVGWKACVCMIFYEILHYVIEASETV